MGEKNSDVPAIDKMNNIFNLLAEEDRGLSQTQICNRLQLSKATVSRLINILVGMGYLENELVSYDYQGKSVRIYAIAALSIPFFGDFDDKSQKFLLQSKECAMEISSAMGSNIKEKNFE